MLAGYNAGWGAVLKARGVPAFPETQKYVQIIPKTAIAAYGGVNASSVSAGGAPAGVSGKAKPILAAANSAVGLPYVWGGESYGGVDCSGLTMLAWESAGVDLPHLSRAQYSYGTHVPIGSMEAGDLIFWSSNGTQSGIYHVAIYLGGGQMIEAPTFGVPVRITGVYSWGSIMPYAVRL